MLALGIAFAGGGWWWRRNRREQAGVRILVRHDAVVVEYSDRFTNGVQTFNQPSPFQEWVDAHLGREFRSDAIVVHLYDDLASDISVITALKQLPGLRFVVVACRPETESKASALAKELQGVEVRTAYRWW